MDLKKSYNIDTFLVVCMVVFVAFMLTRCTNTDAGVTGPELPSVAEQPFVQAPPAVVPTSSVDRPSADVASQDGDSWTFTVTVPGDVSNVIIAAYHDPNRNLATQTLFHSRLYSFSGTRELSIDVPCGRYQVDVFIGRVEPPEPPVIDNTLLIGRIGNGGSCSPPPPPPPPPTCEELENCPPPPCVPEFTIEVEREMTEPTACSEGRQSRELTITRYTVNSCTEGRVFLDEKTQTKWNKCDSQCSDFSGLLCHATGTNHSNQLDFPNGIPPGHCKHYVERHSPGQGPKDFPGTCQTPE
jgi:hypothetical protein